MPEWCVSMRCIECESHAVVHGKLDCNYMNRLGLSQPTVKTFMEDADSPERIEARIKAEKERAAKAKEELARLEKLKEEYGGKKGEQQSS